MLGVCNNFYNNDPSCENSKFPNSKRASSKSARQLTDESHHIFKQTAGFVLTETPCGNHTLVYNRNRQVATDQSLGQN